MIVDLTEQERQEAGEWWEPWGADTALHMAARMVAARMFGGAWEDLADDDDSPLRGDVRIEHGPAAGRWVSVEIAPPDAPLAVPVEASERQASIIVLVYPSNETWADTGELPPALDFRAWCTREHWRKHRRMTDGYWSLAWDRMDPIALLLERLGVVVPPVSVPAARERQPERPKVSKAQAASLANEKPKREWKQYARLSPTSGTCPKGCGDVLDGPARTCWTCNTGYCDVCSGATGAPLLGRCMPCNFKHQEDLTSGILQRSSVPDVQSVSGARAQAPGYEPEGIQPEGERAARHNPVIFGAQPASEYKPTRARKGAR